MLEAVSGLESTYLTLIDAPRGVQQILFARNVKTLQIPEGLSVNWDDTLCKRALEENRLYTDDVPAVWGDSDAARALGIKTYLSQPVHHLDGAVYGTLCGASDTRVPVSPDALKMLALFARLISHQMERERLMDRLRQSNAELSSQALTDPLTQVANRRALIEALNRLLAHAEREGSVVQVAFIDLDGFKAINDTFGHDVGDRFLVHIASNLAAGSRAGDLLARYGGDEFVVISHHPDGGELRDRLEGLTIGRFVTGDTVIDYGGASVGLVCSMPGERDADRLLARADASMFDVKARRRANKRRGEL